MRPVSIMSHYGQSIPLDQCPTCGGIWFDESELFRAKQGEAARIDTVNADSLCSPAEIKDGLVCPRDRARLFRFTDRQFPESIVLLRCPSCHGIWLNRGGFAAYQNKRDELAKARGGLQPVREVLITVPPEASVMEKLGQFLSTDLNTPIQTRAAARTASRAEDTAGAAITVLMTLLRLFLFK